MTRSRSSAGRAAGAALVLAIASCSAPKVESPEQDAARSDGAGAAGGSGGSAGAVGGSGGTAGATDGAAGTAGGTEAGLDAMAEASDAPSDACDECTMPTPGECVLACDPDGLLKFRFQGCTCSVDAGLCAPECHASRWCDSSSANAPTEACVRCIGIWVDELECADAKLSCSQSPTCRPALECLSGCRLSDS